MDNESYVQNVIENLFLENTEVNMHIVMDEIRINFRPKDIFSEDDLKQWALDNGFVKEE